MKRSISILTLGLACAFPSLLSAQSIELGVHAGLTMTEAVTASAESPGLSQGLVVGATASFEIAPPIRLQMEAQYVSKEVRMAMNTTGVPAQGTPTGYTMNYLELPINLKFSFGGSHLRFHLLTGTNIGTLLSAARQIDRNGTAETAIEPTTDISTMNFALELGGGIGYAIAPRATIVADVRYAYGLSETGAEPVSFLDRGSWKTRDVRITSGIIFSL